MSATAEINLIPPTWGEDTKSKKDDEAEFKQPICNNCSKPLCGHDDIACTWASASKLGE